MFPRAARLVVSPIVWRTLWIIKLPTSLSLSLCLSFIQSLWHISTCLCSSKRPSDIAVLITGLRSAWFLHIWIEGKIDTNSGFLVEGMHGCGFECGIVLPGSPPPKWLVLHHECIGWGPCNDIVWYQMPHQTLTCNWEDPSLVGGVNALQLHDISKRTDITEIILSVILMGTQPISCRNCI